jgi:hypothetical protein
MAQKTKITKDPNSETEPNLDTEIVYEQKTSRYCFLLNKVEEIIESGDFTFMDIIENYIKKKNDTKINMIATPWVSYDKDAPGQLLGSLTLCADKITGADITKIFIGLYKDGNVNVSVQCDLGESFQTSEKSRLNIQRNILIQTAKEMGVSPSCTTNIGAYISSTTKEDRDAIWKYCSNKYNISAETDADVDFLFFDSDMVTSKVR